MGKGERSENGNGMGMGKEEMKKTGQDTWREGQNNGNEKSLVGLNQIRIGLGRELW